MLSKPNAEELMSKVGSRYDVALAVAKRARQIADKRIMSQDGSIADAVNLAAIEIDENKVIVTKVGKNDRD